MRPNALACSFAALISAVGSRDYAATATSANSAQVGSVNLREDRKLVAVSWSERREKTLAVGPWMDRSRCTRSGDLNRFMIRSRRRVDWWVFSPGGCLHSGHGK